MVLIRRTVLGWPRRLFVLLLLVLFVLLGYTTVAVMNSHYYLTYLEAAQQAPMTLRDSQTEKELNNGGAQPQTGPLVVLVLSSMPRGGSTLLAELLSAIQDSVLLFEPLWNIEKTDCYKDEACVQRYLMEVFSCTFKDDFEQWLKGKNLFFRYFSKQARVCLSKKGKVKDACLKEMNLRTLCEDAPVVLVKVVRARLAWMNNILQDSLVNLKVIHLARDPRGSLSSISRFRWNNDPNSRCSVLEDDLLAYDKMHHAFPSRVMQVHYEHLCLQPEDTTRDIFHFLFGNDTLPVPVSTFLAQHMLSGTKKEGSMSTFKNSSQEFQAWRFKITEEYLKDIEAEATCLRVIQLMGHAVFGSHAAVIDPTRPLIINTS